MELKWLEDLAALARAGTFLRAAETRGVTQPAFSRRIRTLEDWVGAELIIRTSRGAELTPAGKEFLAGAEDLMHRIARLRRDTRALAGQDLAVLRFAATHALSFTFFPRWIRSVEQAGSSTAIRLSSDSMEACEEQMLLGQAQFMLCHHHASAPGRCNGSAFTSVVVGHDALLPCVGVVDGSPRWSLVERHVSQPLLTYSEESGLGRILAASDIVSRLPELKSVFSGRLAATLLEMVRDGRGIAWLPETLVRHDLASGTLVRAGGPDWEIPVAIQLIRPSARQSSIVERFWRGIEGGE